MYINRLNLCGRLFIYKVDTVHVHRVPTFCGNTFNGSCEFLPLFIRYDVRIMDQHRTLSRYVIPTVY